MLLFATDTNTPILDEIQIDASINIDQPPLQIYIDLNQIKRNVLGCGNLIFQLDNQDPHVSLNQTLSDNFIELDFQ